ncbi:MAG: thiamine phosphate synthase [Myxococcales bacterium]|nr:thiamine phosphate synthase [Myxococcales bacterium]
MTQGLPRIWIITDPNHPDGPVAPVRRALEGCPPAVLGVQLRAKRASDRQIVQWGHELRAITRDTGNALTVNRRTDLAEIIGADGVHVPELGLPPTEIRQHWPSVRILGVSRHDRRGLEAAERARASYAFLSPIFHVPGKTRPMGVHGFRAAIAGVEMPTYALGGVRPEDLTPLLRAGAFGVAIRRAVYASEQPNEAVRLFIRELDKHLPNGE